MIRAGRVRVNGQIATALVTRADPSRDRISIDGRPLPKPQPHTYILLHKPVGVVTTVADPEGRPTVRDLVGRVKIRVYPAGRLDYASSGLVLLTNDGELAMRLMHPRYGVEREYQVKVSGVPGAAALGALRRGVDVEGAPMAARRVTVARAGDRKTWLRLVLCEGRKHEVRRLCAAAGLRVEKLKRVRFGPLVLGSLAPGACRLLTAAEVAALRRTVRLPPGRRPSDKELR